MARDFVPAFLVLSILICILATRAECADKAALLQKANHAYYNLSVDGPIEFRCNAVPDWDAFFKGVPVDAVARDQALPAVKQMKFRVVVGTSGAASISHESDQAPPSIDVADRTRGMASGMEQMISGFFETWSQLMMHEPFPGRPEEYEMSESAEGYQFKANASGIQTAVSVDRDLVINSLWAKTNSFEGTVYPHFTPLQGLLGVESYEVKFNNGSQEQKVSVSVQYQEVQHLELPRTITMAVPTPAGLNSRHNHSRSVPTHEEVAGETSSSGLRRHA